MLPPGNNSIEQEVETAIRPRCAPHACKPTGKESSSCAGWGRLILTTVGKLDCYPIMEVRKGMSEIRKIP